MCCRRKEELPAEEQAGLRILACQRARQRRFAKSLGQVLHMQFLNLGQMKDCRKITIGLLRGCDHAVVIRHQAIYTDIQWNYMDIDVLYDIYVG
jgi:hypothetical protein